MGFTLKHTFGFFAFVLSFANVSAAGYITNNLGDSLKSFIDKVLMNENFLYFIFFVATFFGMHVLFKEMLKFSFKEHSMSNKPLNVISFMFSFIGTSGLFFLFRNGGYGTRDFVTLYGGLIGTLVVIAISIIFLRFCYTWSKGFEDKKVVQRAIWFLGLTISSGVILAYLTFLADQLGALPVILGVLNNVMSDVFVLSLIGLIIFGALSLGGIFSVKGISDSIKEAEEDKNPGVGELRDTLRLINTEVDKLDDYFMENRNFLNKKRIV